jgi:PAS domain S-box-containing protein
MREFAASDPDTVLLEILDNVSDVITVRDAETGETLAVSGAVEEMYGYTPDEFRELSIADYSAGPPEFGAEQAEELLDEVRREGESTFEWKAKRKDGSTFWTEINISKTRLDDRECFVAVVRDITDRKKHEQELQRYERLVSLVSDPVFTIDENDHIGFVNEATMSLTGYSREELEGADPRIVAGDPETTEEHLAELHDLTDGEGDSVRLEATIERADGTEVTIESNMAPLPSDDGEFAGAVGIARDVTDRADREEQLERFASVLSHDLRNPLNAAQAQLTLLRDVEGVESEYLDTVEELHERMVEIIEDVLALAREGQRVTDPQSFGLADVVEEAWTTAAGDADATLSVEGDLGRIEGDERRVRRLLENLFDNAVQHTPDGVHVRVRPLPTGFAVEDDGPGIPESEREEVFDYGYSTADEGTGFGLNIVDEIARAHGWKVSLTESADGGARFEFTDVGE